jgi:hypothetical protein
MIHTFLQILKWLYSNPKKGTEDGILQLGLTVFWTLSIVLYSMFRQMNLLPSSDEGYLLNRVLMRGP